MGIASEYKIVIEPEREYLPELKVEESKEFTSEKQN
mgnify:CR=1 FL=1